MGSRSNKSADWLSQSSSTSLHRSLSSIFLDANVSTHGFAWVHKIMQVEPLEVTSLWSHMKPLPIQSCYPLKGSRSHRELMGAGQRPCRVGGQVAKTFTKEEGPWGEMFFSLRCAFVTYVYLQYVVKSCKEMERKGVNRWRACSVNSSTAPIPDCAETQTQTFCYKKSCSGIHIADQQHPTIFDTFDWHTFVSSEHIRE